MKVNPIGDKIACIDLKDWVLTDFATELTDIPYSSECCKLRYCYVGSNYKLKVNDHSTKYTMKVGALKHFRLTLSSIEKAHIASKIAVLFKLENGLECLRILQNDKKNNNLYV